MIDLDPDRRTANGVSLTPAEWRVIQVLVEAGGEPVREADMDELADVGQARYHFMELRRKGLPVENVKGHGYRLRKERNTMSRTIGDVRDELRARPHATQDNENAYKSGANVARLLGGGHKYSRDSAVGTELAPGMVWYGDRGVSASVGQWIKGTWQLVQRTHHLTGIWVFGTSEDGDGRQWWWNYGLEIAGKLHLAGGFPDFSGEGNGARLLAEEYVDLLFLAPEVQSASVLIDWMAMGWPMFLMEKGDDDGKSQD